MVIKLSSLSSLEKRIEVLESAIPFGADPLQLIINNLSDNDLGLLSEYRELHLAGFTVEEIRGMMGSESFEMAVAVMQKVDREIARLTVPPVRKLVAKKRRALLSTMGLAARKGKEIPIWQSIMKIDVKKVALKFRKSYAYDFWVERLMGKYSIR
ncbi:hypothetical protein [Methanothrix soehngenii]|uniref:hypothetical protein n=1 Tax=Methanothrix soehngenii TaxID=2223 RepID=UPI00300D37C5